MRVCVWPYEPQIHHVSGFLDLRAFYEFSRLLPAISTRTAIRHCKSRIHIFTLRSSFERAKHFRPKFGTRMTVCVYVCLCASARVTPKGITTAIPKIFVSVRFFLHFFTPTIGSPFSFIPRTRAFVSPLLKAKEKKIKIKKDLDKLRNPDKPPRKTWCRRRNLYTRIHVQCLHARERVVRVRVCEFSRVERPKLSTVICMLRAKRTWP